MSKPDYGTMLERFNATNGRGDVLSISREDAARLHELPLEIYGPIFHAMLGWFLTGEETHLDDPRDRAMLAGFKEHQLANAARRGKFLSDQKEKSEKAVEARKLKSTHGSSTEYPRITQVKDKDEDKERVVSSLSSGGSDKRGGHKPPVCTPLSVGDAKKNIKQFVPENIATLHGMMTASGNPTALCSKLISEKDGEECIEFVCVISSALHPEAEDDEEECEKVGKQFDHPLLNLASQIEKKSKWKLALAKAYADANDPTTKVKGKSIYSRDAFIMTRMKIVTNALLTLEAFDGKPLPSEY